MAHVVSLSDFIPLPRFDGRAWHGARVEESASQAGPWVELESFDFNLLINGGLDADPTNPKPRNFTVEDAQVENGWYRVVFFDQSGDQQLPTDPVQYSPQTIFPYTPALTDIGSLLRARTTDLTGAETGTFGAETRPTGDEVRDLIRMVVNDLRMDIGKDIPMAFHEAARFVASLRVAMLIELSYFPEQVNAGKSAYEQYRVMLEGLNGTGGALQRLIDALVGMGADEEPGAEDTQGPGMPYFSFPSTDELVGYRTVM